MSSERAVRLRFLALQERCGYLVTGRQEHVRVIAPALLPGLCKRMRKAQAQQVGWGSGARALLLQRSGGGFRA